MFARTFLIRLKPNSAADFTGTFENEVLPFASKTEGLPGRNHARRPGRKRSARDQSTRKKKPGTYDRGTYPQGLNALAKVVEGTPRLRIYEASNSTFHKIAARVAV